MCYIAVRNSIELGRMWELLPRGSQEVMYNYSKERIWPTEKIVKDRTLKSGKITIKQII